MTIDELEQIRHTVNWIAIAAWCALALWHMCVSDADRRDAKSYRRLLSHVREVTIDASGFTRLDLHVPNDKEDDNRLIEELIARMHDEQSVWMPDVITVKGRQTL